MLKYALLGFLNYQAMTGYDLERLISQSTTHFWHATLTQVYTVLKRLENEGLITSQIEPQEGRPDRRVYEITAVGEEDLLGWLRRPQTEVDAMKAPFILRAFFMGLIDRDTALTHLQLMLQVHQFQHHTFRRETPAAIEAAVSTFALERRELEAHVFFWDATRKLGEKYEEMYIAWLEETIAALKKQNS